MYWNFHAGYHRVIELEESVIKVDLDRGRWIKVMDGQWEICLMKSMVSQ